MAGPEPVPAGLQPLPAPDALEFEMPPGHVCLVSSDGTALTAAFARRLVERGWPVVVLDATSPCTLEGIPTIVLNGEGEEAVRDALAAVSRYGHVAAAVYLQPLTGREDTDVAPDGSFGWDAAVLRLPFLLAKYLQPALTRVQAASAAARPAFVAVARLDGALGMTGQSSSDIAHAGILGLTKSLRLEWPNVFCRAVDLDPELAPEAAADLLLGELCDPDSLTAEVGWGPQGRVTLGTAAGTAGGVA